jgi:hypothetical protein
MRGLALLLKSFLLKSLLVALPALTFISCGAGHRDTKVGSLQSSEAEWVEDSGKRISGSYNLQSVEDDYAAKSTQGGARTTFSFREDGTFAIERESRGAASGVDEGTYIISRQGELVLYIEKIGGDPRSEARVARYLISDQSGDSLKLQGNPSATLILKKR